MGGGNEAAEDDFQSFLAVRRHVKRLQSGTPVLLRTITNDGQEDLQICTFWVTQDLQTLRWREQEGAGSAREVPLSAVASITEDEDEEDGDTHNTIILTMKKAAGSSASWPATIGLICASAEDTKSWTEGLSFLVSSPETVAAPSPKASPLTSPSAAARQAPAPAAVVPAPSATAGPSEEQKRQLRQQAELISRLQCENKELREESRRKDAIIMELQRRASPPGPKTESSSRESDDHLKFREVAMLRSKNRRLQKALRAKQQTVNDLLQLVGKVTSQQAAESSAAETDDGGADAEENEEDEDKLEEEIPKAPNSSPASTGRFQPPARSNGVTTASSERLRYAAEAAPAAAAAARAAESARASPGLSMSSRSKAALQVLAREMQLFEEKKKVVEELARSLEPQSANDCDEDDDGFPLR